MTAFSKACIAAGCLLSPYFLHGVAAQHSHGHSSSEPCACVAAEFGFDIDCTTATGTAKVQTAYDYLTTNNCNDDVPGESVKQCADEADYPLCVKNWFIVKTHHDHCPENVVPTDVEQNFHTWEQYGCLGCEIKKNYRSALPMCPTVDCTNTAVIGAAKAVIADATLGCVENTATAPSNNGRCCTATPMTQPPQGTMTTAEWAAVWKNDGTGSLQVERNEAEQGAWQITRAYHDICEFTQIEALEALTPGIENHVEHTIHDFEEYCEAYECNVSPEGLDQSICPSVTGAAFEWGGVFDVPADTYTWVMQAATANDATSYADPTMRLVVIPTDQTMTAPLALAASECDGTYLMEGACKVIEDGETMGPPPASGACYQLTVSSTSHDTTFTLDATGFNGVVFYAQHVPTEFERDQHYLKLQDGSRTTNAQKFLGTDIEPIAQGTPTVQCDASATAAAAKAADNNNDDVLLIGLIAAGAALVVTALVACKCASDKSSLEKKFHALEESRGPTVELGNKSGRRV